MAGDRVARRSTVELDVAHLFIGHEAQIGSRFQISGIGGTLKRKLECVVVEAQQLEIFPADDESGLGSRLAVELRGSPKPPVGAIPLTRGDAIDAPVRRSRLRASEASPAQFITTNLSRGMS